MRRFLFLVVLLPLAIVVVAFSVANREMVTLSLDPFGSPSPRWSLTLPLFIVLFGTLALGVLIGGIATWLRQGKWRQAARFERANATRLRQDVERLRERVVAQVPALPPHAGRDAA
jgi:uncharacterized integral membrane protein